MSDEHDGDSASMSPDESTQQYTSSAANSWKNNKKALIQIHSMEYSHTKLNMGIILENSTIKPFHRFH